MVESIIKSFEEIISKPERFISAENGLIQDIRKTLKSTYDFTKGEETNNISDALPELIIENFDLEQIWQQIELQNDSILKQNIESVSKLVVDKNLKFNSGEDETQSEDEQEDNNDNYDSEEANENIEEDDIDKSNIEMEVPKKAQHKSSIIDDNFFKLDEMNKFLLSEEKKINNTKKQSEEDSESEESINMFEVGSAEESEEDPDNYNKKKNPRYKDFFESKTEQMRNKKYDENSLSDSDQEYQNEDNSENDMDQNSGVKSALELREERLKIKIGELENAAISEKPWQLKGEILAENRPINSLLEEVLEYDIGTRPAPVITETTTMVLEDVIKQRIKDKSFDDVERKQKPVDTPLEYKKKLVLDQEKSKESLAQIYEKEYLQQQQAVQGNGEEKREEIPQLHKDITSMMNSLFSKLDALSNFHFTPKPVAPELRIISNLPAINMEEVAPVAMTDASLLAPEEVKRKSKGDVIGENERTKTDKNRERRRKKRKQKEHAKAKAKSMSIVKNSGLGNKYSKEKVKKMLEHVSKEKNVDKMDESYGAKGVKSSKAFFTQLQEEVSSQIKNKTKGEKKKTKNMHNAKRLKL